MATKQPIYRVRFINENKVFELYAKEVTQGSLFGFVEISGLLWGRKSDLIVDPTEQDLKNEFSGVTRIHVPMHSIVRVDEVEKASGGKIIALRASEDGSKPAATIPVYTPGGTGPRKAK